MRVEPVYRLIGFKIAFLREQKEMTQAQLAEKIGLDRTSINNIELGRQRILVHYLEEIAEVLGVKPKDLLKGVWY